MTKHKENAEGEVEELHPDFFEKVKDMSVDEIIEYIRIEKASLPPETAGPAQPQGAMIGPKGPFKPNK
ncbi:MAG: hypothetical protein LBS60_11580 [Deltaproteobacteria bacterium]|jgi:hypothetical protein|nr:hypothetical protein [Deltaproteobacteria bacterium]